MVRAEKGSVLLVGASNEGGEASRHPGASLSRHVSLFTMGTTMWTAFLLAGLPSSYFLDWSVAAQFWLIVAIPTVVLLLITRARVRGMAPRRTLAVACLTAFYFTAPFLAYDWVYLGVHKGLGWSFLGTHWFLTAFYLTPWLTLPLLALAAFGARRRRDRMKEPAE